MTEIMTAVKQSEFASILILDATSWHKCMSSYVSRFIVVDLTSSGKYIMHIQDENKLILCLVGFVFLIFLVCCIVLCFILFVFILCLLYPMFPVSPDCPFLISPLGFRNLQFKKKNLINHVSAEALTSGRMIHSGTNNPPAEVSTRW